MKNQPAQPWQLEMFRHSIKKQQKLGCLLDLIGDPQSKECLLVTCGDNTGALNWYFREHGGQWTWADVSGETNAGIAALLGETVHAFPDNCFPFPDERFDCVISIDTLEHLPADQPFLREVKRVLKAGGSAVITVPNGDPRLLANQIKERLGMTPGVYGHTRAGYTADELWQAAARAGLIPRRSGGYSRFFTEIIELAINFAYVRVLSRKNGGAKAGQIAPLSSGELKTHGMAYRLYSIVFPVARAISRLDALLPKRTDNAVVVVAEREGRR